jgi:Zn-dependent protease
MYVMKKPAVVRPTDDVNPVGRVFGTPVVVKDTTWLPMTQVAVWLLMSWLAGRGHVDRPWWKRLGIGALTMSTILGSEWCHNLAHAAAAQLIGKPMDALRVTWGMPLVVYYDINDRSVTPHQHISRALGGPACNGLLLLLALLFRRLARSETVAGDVANAAVRMNAFLFTASLLPIPGIDGGPILKWSLVDRGATPEEADETVRRVNRAVGGGLGVAAAIALRRRRRFVGSILAMFAALSLSVGFGLITE